MSAFKRHVEEAIKDAKFAERYIGQQLSRLVSEGVIKMVKVDGETKFVMADIHSLTTGDK